MCGRFALHTPLAEILRQFGIPEGPAALEPRFNIAPTQAVAAVRERGATRDLVRLRWGLVPQWVAQPGDGPLLINARGETVATKPAFRNALRRRRCLIPADGFYEWERAGRARLPALFAARDGTPLALAGVWERWTSPTAAPVESCAIITTAANGVVAPYHDRMPVVIEPDAYERWLDATLTDPEGVADLIAPLPDDALIARPLDPWVNDVRHEGPRCLTDRLPLFGG